MTPARTSHLPARTAATEGGFSLVELMIAMVASIIVVGSALSMTVQNTRLRKADEEIRLAFVACRNNLEELRSLPAAGLPAMNGVGFDVPGVAGGPEGLRAVPGDADGLPGEFSVTVDQSAGGETIYLVIATVVWSGSLRRQEFALETLMRRRE